MVSDTEADQQLARQRVWLKQMQAKRKELFGDKVFPDSSSLFSEMRDERTRQIEEWAVSKLPADKK
jgi:hypothetical protein